MAAAVAVTATLLAVLAAGWHYSTVLLRPDDERAPSDSTTVVDVDLDQRTVVLDRTRGAERPGVWGLDAQDGYGQAREVVASDDETVTRRLVLLSGELQAGEHVRIDTHAYPRDPADAFVFPTETVELDGGASRLTADVVVPETAPDHERSEWVTAGPRDTWAIVAPDHGAGRSQAYRLVPSLRDLGVPAVVVGHPPEADSAPGGLGPTRRRAVRAAAELAVDRGARQLVLVGFGMGGAGVAASLHENADRVAGAVLDSPVLDADGLFAAAASEARVPRWVTPVTRWLVGVRTGIRWSALDHVARADELDTPILLFHGAEDRAVRVAASDAFAEARPDLVTYVRVEGAGHGEAWNVDPAAYTARLRGFLSAILE